MKLSRLDAYKDGKVVQWCAMQASSYYSECVINCHNDNAGVYTVTPDKCTVPFYTVHTGQGSCSKNSYTGTPSQASCLIRAISEVSFSHSDSRCPFISDLFSFIPRYVDILVKDRNFLLSVMLSLHPASLLLRWKAATKSKGMLLVSLGLG